MCTAPLGFARQRFWRVLSGMHSRRATAIGMASSNASPTVCGAVVITTAADEAQYGRRRQCSRLPLKQCLVTRQSADVVPSNDGRLLTTSAWLGSATTPAIIDQHARERTAELTQWLSTMRCTFSRHRSIKYDFATTTAACDDGVKQRARRRPALERASPTPAAGVSSGSAHWHYYPPA